MDVLIVAGVTAVAVLLLFALLFRSLASPARQHEVNLERLREFSVARYHPMERLLSEADESFIGSQPGFEPRLSRKLRARRRAIFRAYLRDLASDFAQLHLAARICLLHARQDEPELARALLRQRVRFSALLWEARLRLVLHAAGVGTVPVSGLLETLESLEGRLRRMAPLRVSA